VPIYDIRCRACGTTFEVSRPMAQVNDPAPCPAGHEDTVRLLPTVAMTGRAAGRSAVRSPAAAPAAGGGCCGGGCCG
jgi:putative FmdB family regulatory protein